jgi:hypothetical protein
LLPVWRVLESLIVVRKRFLNLAPLGQRVSPCLQRIGPVRSPLVRVLGLFLSAVDDATVPSGLSGSNRCHFLPSDSDLPECRAYGLTAV